MICKLEIISILYISRTRSNQQAPLLMRKQVNGSIVEGSSKYDVLASLSTVKLAANGGNFLLWCI